MITQYFTQENRALIAKYLSENNPVEILSDDSLYAENRIEDFIINHRINNVLESFLKRDGYASYDFTHYIKYLEIRECLFPKFCRNLVFNMYVTVATTLKVFESYGRVDFKKVEPYLFDQNAIFIFNEILEHYTSLLSFVIDRLEYFDGSLNFKACMSKLGLNDIDLLKYHNVYKGSKLRPVVLLNYIDRDKFKTKEKYEIEDGPRSNIDLCLWLSHYKQWYDSSTTFTYKDVDVKVHNHTVAKYVEVPYKNGGFDMSKHPSKCIRKKGIDIELNSRYTIAHKKFELPHFLKDTDEFRFLRTGLDMLNEGQVMNNCIGGTNYIERALKENYYYAHMNSPDCAEGITIEFAPGTKYAYHIGQAFRKGNKTISEYELQRVQAMLAHINRHYECIKPTYGIDEQAMLRVMYGT